ncbi:neprilysin-2-like [Ixodes scapularis]
MNQTVDPCENFYEFACGGWVHRHPIPEDRSSVSQLSFIRDQLDAKLRTLVEEPPENSEPGFIHKMKHMYRSCFNTSLIDSYAEEPLQKVLKVLGGWPVVEGPGWNASKFHWLNALIQYRNFGYSHNILLDLHVTLDPRNNTRYIIVLDEASLGLPDRTYFLKGLNDSVVAAYLKLMTEAAQLLGANQKAAETELREALQFEIALANAKNRVFEAGSSPNAHTALVSDTRSEYVPKQATQITGAARASTLIQNMNQTVDPCENFYEFACGGWVHRHPIPEDRSSVSQLSFIRDQLDAKLRTLVEEPPENSEPGFIHKMKHMYRSCFNTSLIDSYAEEPLQKVLKVLGGWPVVEGPGWNASKFHWLNALIQYRNFGYSHNILLDLHVTLDPRNNTRYIIVLDEASLGLPDRTYFLKGLNDSVVAAYLKLMTEAAQLLGANQKAAETELREALQFEIALANVSNAAFIQNPL